MAMLRSRICRRIVEEHGGVMAIESELGRGKVVRIRLPATSNGKFKMWEEESVFSG